MCVAGQLVPCLALSACFCRRDAQYPSHSCCVCCSNRFTTFSSYIVYCTCNVATCCVWVPVGSCCMSAATDGRSLSLSPR